MVWRFALLRFVVFVDLVFSMNYGVWGGVRRKLCGVTELFGFPCLKVFWDFVGFAF